MHAPSEQIMKAILTAKPRREAETWESMPEKKKRNPPINPATLKAIGKPL